MGTREAEGAEQEFDRLYRRHPLETRLRYLFSERARRRSELDKIEREIREIRFTLSRML